MKEMASAAYVENQFGTIYVVGSGVLHDDIVKLATELQVDDIITFTGYVDNDELIDFMKVIIC